MNLYELSTRYQQLLDQDELSLEDCQELETLHETIEDECISRGKYIRNKQAELEAVTAARKEMQEREKSLAAKIDRNEEFLAHRMQQSGLNKITKSPLFPLRVRVNPVSVDDYEPTLIPEKFRYFTEPKPVEKIDKNSIKLAIESGEDVPGARLVSKLRIEFK